MMTRWVLIIALTFVAFPGCSDESEPVDTAALSALDGSEWCGRDGFTYGFECAGDEAQFMRLSVEGSALSGRFCEAADKDCSPLVDPRLSGDMLTFTFTFGDADQGGVTVVGGAFTLSADRQTFNGKLTIDGSNTELSVTLRRAAPSTAAAHVFESGEVGPVSGWQSSDWARFCDAAEAHVLADAAANIAACTLSIRQGGATCTEATIAECTAPTGASAGFSAKCGLRDADDVERARCDASVEDLERCTQALRHVLAVRGASATCDSNLAELNSLPTPVCTELGFEPCGFYPLSLSE